MGRDQIQFSPGYYSIFRLSLTSLKHNNAKDAVVVVANLVKDVANLAKDVANLAKDVGNLPKDEGNLPKGVGNLPNLLALEKMEHQDFNNNYYNNSCTMEDSSSFTMEDNSSLTMEDSSNLVMEEEMVLEETPRSLQDMVKDSQLLISGKRTCMKITTSNMKTTSNGGLYWRNYIIVLYCTKFFFSKISNKNFPCFGNALFHKCLFFKFL